MANSNAQIKTYGSILLRTEPAFTGSRVLFFCYSIQPEFKSLHILVAFTIISM